MGREEARGGDSDGVRREKKKEKKWEILLWERLNERKKILFPELEEDNIYRSYVPRERERDCFPIFFLFF